MSSHYSALLYQHIGPNASGVYDFETYIKSECLENTFYCLQTAAGGLVWTLLCVTYSSLQGSELWLVRFDAGSSVTR